MGWGDLLIKLSALLLLKCSRVTFLKCGRETLYLNNAFRHQTACTNRFHSVEILLFDVLPVEKFSSKCYVVMFLVRKGLLRCLEIKYEKS